MSLDTGIIGINSWSTWRRDYDPRVSSGLAGESWARGSLFSRQSNHRWTVTTAAVPGIDHFNSISVYFAASSRVAANLIKKKKKEKRKKGEREREREKKTTEEVLAARLTNTTRRRNLVYKERSEQLGRRFEMKFGLSILRQISFNCVQTFASVLIIYRDI